MTEKRAELVWNPNGVPVSRLFDDPYFSLESGVAETEHVFLAGNNLPARFCPGFQVAELGFGTGLNFLTALRSWRQTMQEGRMKFTSFEAFPMVLDEMRAALSHYPFLPSDPFDSHSDSLVLPSQIEGPDYQLQIIYGDARETLAQWGGKADAWFLDGFSPAKNPELWEKNLMCQVAERTNPGGTFATYTAAGFVRRSLENAGFEVERSPGFGRKRHMTRGRLAGLEDE